MDRLYRAHAEGCGIFRMHVIPRCSVGFQPFSLTSRPSDATSDLNGETSSTTSACLRVFGTRGVEPRYLGIHALQHRGRSPPGCLLGRRDQPAQADGVWSRHLHPAAIAGLPEARGSGTPATRTRPVQLANAAMVARTVTSLWDTETCQRGGCARALRGHRGTAASRNERHGSDRALLAHHAAPSRSGSAARSRRARRSTRLLPHQKASSPPRPAGFPAVGPGRMKTGRCSPQTCAAEPDRGGVHPRDDRRDGGGRQQAADAQTPIAERAGKCSSS